MLSQFPLPERMRRSVWQLLYRVGSEKYESVVAGRLGYNAATRVAEAYCEFADPQNGPVLDIGCGTGLVGQELQQQCAVKIDGTDISADMIRVAAQKNVYRELFIADLRSPSALTGRKYRGALCAGVFTHGHVGAEALPTLLNALEPDSIFAFTVIGDLWHKSFAPRLSALETEGVIELLRVEELTHFAAVKAIRSQLVTLRIARGGA